MLMKKKLKNKNLLSLKNQGQHLKESHPPTKVSQIKVQNCIRKTLKAQFRAIIMIYLRITILKIHNK